MAEIVGLDHDRIRSVLRNFVSENFGAPELHLDHVVVFTGDGDFRALVGAMQRELRAVNAADRAVALRDGGDSALAEQIRTSARELRAALDEDGAAHDLTAETFFAAVGFDIRDLVGWCCFRPRLSRACFGGPPCSAQDDKRVPHLHAEDVVACGTSVMPGSVALTRTAMLPSGPLPSYMSW